MAEKQLTSLGFLGQSKEEIWPAPISGSCPSSFSCPHPHPGHTTLVRRGLAPGLAGPEPHQAAEACAKMPPPQPAKC